MSAERGTGMGRRLAANAFHAASGRLVALALWVVFTPAILRVLGPSGFGVWALFYALTGYLFALDFGLAQGTVRAVAAARERGDHAEAAAFASLALWGYLGLGLLWIGLALIAREGVLAWLRIPLELVPDATFAMVAGAAVFTLVGVANVGIAVLQGHGRFDLGNLALLGMILVQGLGIGISLATGGGLRGLVLAVGASGALGCALCAALLARLTPGVRWAGPGAARPHLEEALRFGGPVQVTNALAAVHAHVDKILLSRFVALAAVTSFELGSRIAISVASLPQLLLLPVIPETAALHAAGHAGRLRELYDRASRYYLTAVAAVTAPLVAAGARVYDVWLGGPQPEAALALRVLALATALALFSGLATTMARGIGRTDLEAWLAAASVAFHVVLSVILVPRLGLSGALIAIAISNLVATLGFMAAFGRRMGWPLLGGMLRPFAVPAVAIAVGGLAGAWLDRTLPAGAGLMSWLLLGAVAGLASVATMAVILLTGFFHWREARTLLLPAR